MVSAYPRTILTCNWSLLFNRDSALIREEEMCLNDSE